MDSSLNKPSQIIEINSYVVNNLNLFDSILNSLESVSTEAKTFLKEKMSTDGRLDNKLFGKVPISRARFCVVRNIQDCSERNS